MSLLQYLKADGINRQAVSEATPLPVTGSLDFELGAGTALIGKVQIVKSDGTTIVDPVPAGAAALASASPVTTATDEIKLTDVTLTVDTSAYASGDLIADAQIVAACVKADDATGILVSLVVIDEDAQGAAFDVWFYRSSASWGSENSAPSITDANAREILGVVPVATGDYKNLGGSRVATLKNIGLVIRPVSSSDDIYVAVVNGSGTPTYTASGLKLRVGIAG